MTTKAIISKNVTDIEIDILRLIKEGSISEKMLFSDGIFYYISGYYEDEIVLYKDVMTAINHVTDFIINKCKH